MDRFPGLEVPRSGYKTILIDPPWKYGKWGKASIAPPGSTYTPNASIMPFDYMTVDQIKRLPVRSIAADNCDLYLWTTQRYLKDAFSVLDAWGFKYCQTLTWCKTPKGTGQGGLFCPTTEFLLLSRVGKMPASKTRIDTTWWHVKRPMKHSAKPEDFYVIIERQGDSPRCELFARKKRNGWAAWGNEIDDLHQIV